MAQHGERLIVGAPDATVGDMSYAGKVFAYKVSKDGSLSNLGILTAPEVQRAASFGQGITLSSDTLVISANRSKVNDLTAAGAVHLYAYLPGRSHTTLICSGASEGGFLR